MRLTNHYETKPEWEGFCNGPNSLANLNLYEHVGRYADAAGNDRKVL